MSVVFAADFDNRPRHCWTRLDGSRVLADRGADYEWPEAEPLCKTDHSADPKVVGKVEWMRFIHAMHDACTVLRLVQPFAGEDGELRITFEQVAETSDGRRAYAEVYTWPLCQRPHALVFLSKEGWARIELFDLGPDYVTAAGQALLTVANSYKEVAA